MTAGPASSTDAMPSTDSPSSDSYLRIRRLTKKFGEFTALADISLDVLEGEFVCFLGPSGCGKTTLLRAIAGLDIQSAGTVEQAGADISALPPVGARLRDRVPVLRAVPEHDGGAQRRLRAGESEALARGGSRSGAGAARSGRAAGPGRQVPGAAIGRTTAAHRTGPGDSRCRPACCCSTKPLSALDAKVRARLRYEVKALQRRLGVTTIMVTHDQGRGADHGGSHRGDEPRP